MRRFAWLLLISCMSLAGADLQEIIRRGTAAIKTDWAADPDYAYMERNEFERNGKPASRTDWVVMLDGSDYRVPLANNDEPLSPPEFEDEVAKMRIELQRRKGESAAARRKRTDAFRKEHDENGALLLDAPNAFDFALLREETMNGYPVYVLSATPRKRGGTLTRAGRVLSGMHVTLWIEKDSFHVIRGEAEVVNSVPVYGILAKVLPGTRAIIDMKPVTDSVWLVSDFAMTLSVSKFLLFRSTQVTRTTFCDYRPNEVLIEDLLSKAGDRYSN